MQRLTPASNKRPRGTLIADQRGRGQGHSQFYSIGFYVHRAAFFDSFLGSKKES